MSLHNKPEYNTPEIVAALKQHGLDVGTPSQLSDTFRLGWLASLEAALAAQPDPVEAQAVPDLPVAWKHEFNDPHSGQRASALCRRHPADYELLPGDVVTPLFTRPTPAAADLHQQIMNLPINWTPGTSIPTSYLDGHRDARHAAAQLVAASPAAAAQQPVTKEQALESLSEVGLWLSRDPHALRLRQFIEQLIPVAPVGAPTEEREAFEAHVLSLGSSREALLRRDFPDSRDYGEYVDVAVQIAWDAWNARALLSRQGCELATDATKQLGDDGVDEAKFLLDFQRNMNSVHLAATPIDQDFRRRPASSEAAPSAEGSGPHLTLDEWATIHTELTRGHHEQDFESECPSCTARRKVSAFLDRGAE